VQVSVAECRLQFAFVSEAVFGQVLSMLLFCLRCCCALHFFAWPLETMPLLKRFDEQEVPSCRRRRFECELSCNAGEADCHHDHFELHPQGMNAGATREGHADNRKVVSNIASRSSGSAGILRRFTADNEQGRGDRSVC